MAGIATLADLQNWIVTRDGQTSQAVNEYIQANRIGDDVAAWFESLQSWLSTVDWEGRRGPVIEIPDLAEAQAEWRSKAIETLMQWVRESSDVAKTIDLWAAVHIQCGTCYQGWQDWLASNPIDDLDAWLNAAVEVVTRNRWI